jgi:hypothetical protein
MFLSMLTTAVKKTTIYMYALVTIYKTILHYHRCFRYWSSLYLVNKNMVGRVNTVSRISWGWAKNFFLGGREGIIIKKKKNTKHKQSLIPYHSFQVCWRQQILSRKMSSLESLCMSRLSNSVDGEPNSSTEVTCTRWVGRAFQSLIVLGRKLLLYCSYHKQDIQALEKVQRKGARFVTGKYS